MTFISFMNYFNAANTMELLLALLLFIMIVTMVCMSLNPTDSFDLKDLVSENGKLVERKFTRFGAWVISTWGFVYILVNNPNTFPEWYFVGYMTVWVGNAIMGKYMNGKAEPPTQ
jgi:hypothetical protein